MNVPIGKIRPNPHQERKTFDDIGVLATTMTKHGFWGSLVARQTKNGYEIAFGERRLLAAKKAGIKEIDLEVQDLTDEQMMVLTTVENTQRTDVPPLERAEHLAKIQKETGWSLRDMATHLHMPIKTVDDALELAGVRRRTKDLIRDGKIGWSPAMEAERVGGEELVETAVKEKLTKDDIREIKDAIRVAPNLKKELVTREMHPSELTRQRLEKSTDSPSVQAKKIRTAIEHCGLEVEHLTKIFHKLIPIEQYQLALTLEAHREYFNHFWEKVGIAKFLAKGVPKV